ncbi:NADH-quinone oxidoreductase subunit A [bacterium]|nr:NADH-quinone oxidoreductase subunit A [bacterium]MBU1985335.1 NADH-quinone oxidoreductase subunit A [bacterium]
MNFGPILIFFIAGAAVVVAALFFSHLLAPYRPNQVKLSTYECGEEPVGSPWIRFNTRFYVIALIFLVFDVEVLFLFPWAVNLRQMGLFAWIDMAIFIAILAVGLAYVWGRGDLDWVRPKDSSLGPEATRR